MGHGSSMISPRPPHFEQGWLIEKNPWLCPSTPRPPQRSQTLGAVPGFAPDPPHVSQRDCFGTETETSVPAIAWAKLSDTSVCRSRPGMDWAAGPPRRPKSDEKMSPMSEVKPPAPGPRPPKPAKPPPESYSRLFSASERAS